MNVDSSGESRSVVKSIEFTTYPSELVAIMGLSGAGKSTLLSILNGSVRADEGDVLINGQSLSENYDTLKQLIGYVPQDDIIHSELTVYEALFYSSRLRLSKNLSDIEIDRKINRVLKALGIYGVKDKIVGSPERRGISGGERKRVI